MADLTYTKKATERRQSAGLVPGKGDAHSLKVLCSSTIELVASASGATVKFGTIPSNARLSGLSRVYWDDLATSGAPTLDIGLASVGNNITNDPDALATGGALSAVSGAGGIHALSNIDRFGKQAWELVNGQATDPGGQLDVYGSVVAAATLATGTVTLELLGYID